MSPRRVQGLKQVFAFVLALADTFHCRTDPLLGLGRGHIDGADVIGAAASGEILYPRLIGIDGDETILETGVFLIVDAALSQRVDHLAHSLRRGTADGDKQPFAHDKKPFSLFIFG